MSDGLNTDGFVSVEQGGTAEPAPEVIEHDAQPEPGSQDNDPEGEPAPEPEAKKPRKSADERIAEVTRARREAERERDHWRSLAEGKGEQKQPANDAEPNPEDYDYGEVDPKYVKDLIAHETKRALDAAGKDRAQSEANQAQARVWEAAHEAARAEFADFDDTVLESAKRNEWPLTEAMFLSAVETDSAGKILHHLATNPDEAHRIAALSPLSQAREIGRLEGRLTAPLKPKPTNAPQPPDDRARGAGGKFSVADDSDDFAAFEKRIASILN